MGIVNPFANDGDWTESGGNVYRESGKVGIGTDDPQRPLHVSGVGQFGDSTNPGDIKVYGSTGSTPSLTVGLTDAGAGQDWQIQNTSSDFTLAMGSGINPLTVSNSDGYVGINEATPLYSLDIDASNGMRISYGASSGGGGLLYNVSNSYLSIITSENIDSSQTCGLNIKSSGKRILLTNSGVGGNEVLSKGTTDNSICLLSTDIRMGNTTTLNASVVPDFLLSGGDAVFTGNVDAESLTVDNITIDADDIILSSGPMTVQAAGGMTVASVDQSVVIETNAKILLKKNGTTEIDIEPGTIEFSNNQNSNLNLEATAHNVVGKDLTLSGGSTTAGTTDNIAGGDLIISGGQGKGTGNGGAIYLKTAPASTSGSTLNALASAMTIKEGRVGIGTEVPNSGALLELASTTQALILPRMNTTQRDAIAGENGMLIYNSSTNKLNAFCNGSWEAVTSS
tara:strand:- start:562 stop:1920 length:1359 start_codon:yes stop_codon:yes gene_type:complete